MITIGICFSETKYPNFPAWLLEGSTDVELIELFWEKQNLDDLKRCHGILLTGGVDIDPFFFAAGLKSYPNQPKEWNRIRDRFELDLFEMAQTLKMPVVGICRGLQLINIALGGTLIADLEAAGEKNHRNMNGVDYLHPVVLEQDSLLYTICGVESSIANSAHHQAIDRIAERLIVNCYSDDQIVEGIEWRDKKDRSPMIAVQWHPERIENKQINPLSQNIKNWFFEEARKFKQ